MTQTGTRNAAAFVPMASTSPILLGQKKLSRQQCMVRSSVHRSLPSLRRAIPLEAFASITSLSSARLMIQCMGDGVPMLPADWIAIAFCHSGGARAGVLYLPNTLVRRWIGCALHRQRNFADALRPCPFDEGVLMQLLDVASADWRAAGFSTIELRGVLDSQAQVGAFMALNQDIAWHVSARFESDTVNGPVVFAGCRVPLPPAVSPLLKNSDIFDGSSLPVSFRMVVGTSTLLLREVKNIEKGDVIILDALGVPFADGQDVRFALWSGYYVISAHWIDSTTFCVDGVSSMQHSEQTQPLSVQSPENSAAGMEIQVQVEVARISMTVQEASRLVAGQVIHLRRPVSEEVAIRAADQLICTGHLVQVEGELAVEITEVL